MEYFDTISYIFKSIMQVGIAILSLYLYKQRKNIGWLFTGIAFSLELYEILYLELLFPYWIYILISIIQAGFFVAGVIILVKSYRKNR